MRHLLSLLLVFTAGTVSAEDSKKEDEAKEARARDETKQLEMACKKFYLENGGEKWPAKLADIVHDLKNPPKDLLDPWGKKYEYKLGKKKLDDGTVVDEWPYVWTERTVNGKVVVYGNKPGPDKDKK